MSMNENSPDVSMVSGAKSRQRSYALHPLHEAAMRIADLGLSKPRAKTRDLVALLICHGARAWRSSQPGAGIHLHVTSHVGRAPIRLRLR